MEQDLGLKQCMTIWHPWAHNILCGHMLNILGGWLFTSTALSLYQVPTLTPAPPAFIWKKFRAQYHKVTVQKNKNENPEDKALDRRVEVKLWGCSCRRKVSPQLTGDKHSTPNYLAFILLYLGFLNKLVFCHCFHANPPFNYFNQEIIARPFPSISLFFPVLLEILQCNTILPNNVKCTLAESHSTR